ncbi:DUF5681 domain-containing protein [Parablastomonas sp. CN1-191]|uniref:DUF5681 domain-containing protein n=1 Tax=Parablastomonas sp. CN1-191 TaxID=3400908 RepID=UPI003BF91737
MSDDREKAEAARAGRRKDGLPFKEGNTREDGSYAVGKYRTPESGKFAVGDGRKRGRRAKGVRNVDSDFEEEFNRRVTVTEGGKKRSVSKGRASIIRLLDNGYSKGQTAAIIEIDRRHQRLLEKKAASQQRTVEADAALLEAYIKEMLGQTSAGPHLLGDPEEGGEPSACGEAEGTDEEQSDED